jgi:hypothetical protein
LRAVLADKVGQRGYRIEYRFGFGRVRQPYAVVFFEQEGDFQCVDRVESQPVAEQRRVGRYLVGGDLLEVQRFDNISYVPVPVFQVFHQRICRHIPLRTGASSVWRFSFPSTVRTSVT